MAVGRSPAVAGVFYPAEASQLRAQVDAFLAVAVPAGEPVPKALIVPHAGYCYSGAVAGTAYARLREGAAAIARVVLLGPAHRVAVGGLAVPAATHFVTPLGTVPVDREAVAALRALPFVVEDDVAHAREHSLEVQLPFLQQALGHGFCLVPLAVGRTTPADVAAALDVLWDGPQTLVVVSSDLSHYQPYEIARRLDAQTSRQIEQLAWEDLGLECACGCTAIQGLLRAARQRGLRVRAVDVRNSGDTAGPRDRVVGYGSYVVTEGSALAPELRQVLLQVARSAVEHGALHGRGLTVRAEDYPPPLRQVRASFVTLRRADDQLRGCIGSCWPQRPLVADVAYNAHAAAQMDPRFPPVTTGELPGIRLHISLLSVPERMAFGDEAELLAQVRAGIDGLILESRGRRGTFLPAVWEALPDVGDFVRQLKLKAGLPPTHWSADVVVHRYTAESIHED